MAGAFPRRSLVLAVVLGLAGGLGASLPAAAETAAAPVDSAPANPLDRSMIPTLLTQTARRSAGKGGELSPDGSSGFRPFESRSYSYGAYRFQLVDSGSDGDIEVLRAAVVAAAHELTRFTNISFTVDPGLAARPTVVDRFAPGYCGIFDGHRCSLFADRDRTIGVIRIEFSDGSPCGAMAPSGTQQGVVGCGGPESARGDDGTAFHLRGNVWLSPSLTDVNAAKAGSIVAHEIGHALGLDHYDETYTAVPGATPVRQLMFPSVHNDPSDIDSVYRSGDIQGVWFLHLPDAWFVTATYRDFLGRVPDTGGYHHWIASRVTPDSYVDALATSDEWIGRILTDFYLDVFGRAPDPGGFAYWSGLVRTLGVPAVAAELYGSTEYLQRAGGTATGVVQNLYRELLGRDPDGDPNGVAYWVDQASQRGRVEVAHAFFQSDEKRRLRVAELYCALLDRPPESGGLAYWAGVILFQGDLALARNLATSHEYLVNSDEFSLLPLTGSPTPPGC